MEIKNFTISRTGLELSMDKIMDAILRAFSSTSLNIIAEVMGVPVCAVKSIWRQGGNADVNPSSLCIDEERLVLFTDAYIRKMKNYFRSSVRNHSELTFEEAKDFGLFVESFKKKECKSTGVTSWSQIDEEALRNSFVERVKKSAQSKRLESYINGAVCLDIFSGCAANLHESSFTIEGSHDIIHGGEPVVVRLGYYYIRESSFIGSSILQKKQDCLLSRITRSRFYRRRQNKAKRVKQYLPRLYHLIFVSARYHIFSADDSVPDSISSRELIRYCLTGNVIRQTIDGGVPTDQLYNGQKQTYKRHTAMQLAQSRQESFDQVA